MANNIPFTRYRLDDPDERRKFALFETLGKAGVTDYVAIFETYGRATPMLWADHLPSEAARKFSKPSR